MKDLAAKLARPSALLWIGLSLLIVWAVRQVPFAGVGQVLRSVSLPALASLVAFNLVAMFFFSSRWWLALRLGGQSAPYKNILAYRMAAFSVSYFTPGSQFGGEPLQVYLLQSRHAIPASTALASVTLDKLFELLANFTFLAIGVSLILRQGLLAGLGTQQAGAWIGALLLLPVVYLALLSSGRSPLSALFARLPERLLTAAWQRSLPDLVASAELQIISLLRRKPAGMLSLLLASALIWAFSLAEYWLTLYVFGASVSLPQAVIALTAARLAFLTPLPAGLGALEAGQALALQALGFDPALGLAVSLWIRGRDFALGALGLWLGAWFGLPKSLGFRKPVHVMVDPLPSRASE